jgi:hypothetical protein
MAPYKVPVKVQIVEEAQHSGRFKKMRKMPPSSRSNP